MQRKICKIVRRSKMDEKMKNMKNLIEAKNFEDEKNYIE